MDLSFCLQNSTKMRVMGWECKDKVRIWDNNIKFEEAQKHKEEWYWLTWHKKAESWASSRENQKEHHIYHRASKIFMLLSLTITHNLQTNLSLQNIYELAASVGIKVSWRTVSNLFYEASIILIPKPDSTKKEKKGKKERGERGRKEGKTTCQYL